MYKLLKYDEVPTCRTSSVDGLPKEYRVGVEVELENIYDTELPNNSKWNVENDGSLKKAGKEFIFKRALSGRSVEIALNQLDKVISRNDNTLAGSRTSVHVHVDVLDMTRVQLLDLLRLYVLLEKVLYRVGGYHRYTNNNCLPLGGSVKFSKTISTMKERVDDDASLIREMYGCSKYAGCNLSSVVYGIDNGQKGRGSLEFRMHEGTKDTKRILSWIKVLLKLKKFAMEEDVSGIVEEFSATGPIRFIEGLFEEMYDFVRDCVNVDDYQLEEDLYEGVRNLQFIDQYNHLFASSSGYLKSCYTSVYGEEEEEREDDELDDGEEGVPPQPIQVEPIPDVGILIDPWDLAH